MNNFSKGTSITAAAAAVADGKIIAYPTEGVFGIGCDPANHSAVAQLLAIKKRQSDKGLILLAANRRQLAPYVGTQSEEIEAKLKASWPGAVTWILPCIEGTSDLLTGARPTLAARITSHPPAAELCLQCGHAIISTSANRSGAPACRTATEVAELFVDDISYLLDLPLGNLDGPTPIFDGTSGKQLR